MIIPEEYYKKEKIVKLTQRDIDMIITELEDAGHHLFMFLGYDKIVKKLKEKKI